MADDYLDDDTMMSALEALVLQIDDDTRDTAPLRAVTHREWPPEPPLPAELEEAFAIGTQPPRSPRHAGIYAAVRRPTTSGDW